MGAIVQRNVVLNKEKLILYFIYAYYHIPNLHIELVKNAPEDGPVRSETCRANICDE